ncbi:MAG: hypothetical protein JWR26_2527 [Pedosphaera sp.]|nr:hypothetical protein [Pedosphaera sp.]
MKQNSLIKHAGLLITALGLGTAAICPAQTNFTVTSPNYIFDINGVGTGLSPGFDVNNCPALSLHAGATYTFTVSTSAIHPMGIVTTQPVSAPSSSPYAGGVPTSQSAGTITLTIPATGFPSKLYYQCNFHGFYGVITVLPPLAAPAPPANNIISLVFSGTNVVVRSSGTTTTYTLVPEFNSNLVSGTWQSVPSFTNTFAAGTNTTTFGRLDAICGPNVFLRISQRP